MKTMYERCQEVMPQVANRATTLGVVSGKGCYLTTDDGRQILDFACGVAVNNIGLNHDAVVQATKNQIDALIHGGHNVVYYEPYVTLAEELVAATGGDTMVYFSNSGAEANDGAVKLAKYVTGKSAVIAFKNSFHGRTIGSTALTASSSKYRKHYDFLSGIYFAEYANCFRCPFNQKKESCSMECLKQFDSIFESLADPECVAAIMLEPIQGEGGYIVPPVEFLKGLREICDRYNILLIFDEVQTGFGRTGNLYAYQTFGVKPDILTSAKALGGGLPLSAIIAKKEIMSRWPAGAHGGTFGGNPVACAASLATLKVLQGGAMENCKKMGRYFMDELKSLKAKYPKYIADVRGAGLMIAMEMADSDKRPNADITSKIQKKALERGVLLLTCGHDKNVVRFIAPTTVTEKEIDMAIGVIDSILAEESR